MEIDNIDFAICESCKEWSKTSGISCLRMDNSYYNVITSNCQSCGREKDAEVKYVLYKPSVKNNVCRKDFLEKLKRKVNLFLVETFSKYNKLTNQYRVVLDEAIVSLNLTEKILNDSEFRVSYFNGVRSDFVLHGVINDGDDGWKKMSVYVIHYRDENYKIVYDLTNDREIVRGKLRNFPSNLNITNLTVVEMLRFIEFVEVIIPGRIRFRWCNIAFALNEILPHPSDGLRLMQSRMGEDAIVLYIVNTKHLSMKRQSFSTKVSEWEEYTFASEFVKGIDDSLIFQNELKLVCYNGFCYLILEGLLLKSGQHYGTPYMHGKYSTWYDLFNGLPIESKVLQKIRGKSYDRLCTEAKEEELETKFIEFVDSYPIRPRESNQLFYKAQKEEDELKRLSFVAFRRQFPALYQKCVVKLQKLGWIESYYFVSGKEFKLEN